ncbi:MAG TPA: ATP-binding protein [Candidatus Acidoferrum sp.]|jgi:signal transduction histidine kinase|nr:ATP-binding protein [Candidatus Acidoferrum sp.]
MSWRKARWAFGMGVALLLVSAIAAGILIVRIQESNRRVMHAFTIQVSLENLESSLSAAGRARTLYVSNRDRKYLSEANARLSDSASQLDAILAQTSDIAAHHDSYTQLAVLTNRRMAIIRSALLDAEAGKTDSSAQDGYTRQIVDVADQIKIYLEDLETHEQAFADQGRIVSEQLFLAIVVVLATAFGVALALLYLNYRFLLAELAERRRAERSAIESQETLRLLSVRLIRMQDEQSRKFSRELHDGLGQYLSLAKMNLSRYMRTGVTQTELLAEAIELLDRSIAETRTISYLLHPPLLDDMGFLFAARWYIEGFSERSGIRVTANIPENSARLPLPVEVALFRVLQECLANIHRHSGSTSAEVTLVISPADASLRVRDYGKGVPVDVLKQFRATGGRVGVGLAGMRERVREQGGHFDIESGSSGTTVTVRIPAAVPQASPQSVA